MLFNSGIFVVFFIIVYFLYISFHRKVKIQNKLLLIASYVFYGYWDWRFLSLLLISTVIDFTVGSRLQKTEDATRRKILVTISLISNLSILGFFKYFNFFAENFSQIISTVGMKADSITLNIILPIGISFYTFQTLSYTIDIYRKKIGPTKSILDFALFVAFFPQLVAGPIERAKTLLPQITSARKTGPDQFNAGIFLIIWGYYKKVVIADNLAIIADQVFNGYTNYQGMDLVIGVLAFTFQIYCDFSGYSDIARGLAKLLGFDLRVNFKLPYFSLNPSDFWLRWHVSLSSWLRDYLYISLGGNKVSSFNIYRNLLLTMLLGGLWHGASWNFVIWGLFHGTILIIYRLFDKDPEHMDPWGGQYSYIRVIIKMLIMFLLTCIGWIIFRSQTVEQIIYIITNLGLGLSGNSLIFGFDFLIITTLLIIVNFIMYIKRDLLIVTKLSRGWLVSFYVLILFNIAVFSVRDSHEFIYFQF